LDLKKLLVAGTYSSQGQYWGYWLVSVDLYAVQR
jgi:hypothetical protein